jgi:hypothetical protein
MRVHSGSLQKRPDRIRGEARRCLTLYGAAKRHEERCEVALKLSERDVRRQFSAGDRRRLLRLTAAACSATRS